MACEVMQDCSTARAAYTSYCAAVGCGDDDRQEMAFLAGVAWAMSRTDELVRLNREYVDARTEQLTKRCQSRD